MPVPHPVPDPVNVSPDAPAAADLPAILTAVDRASDTSQRRFARASAGRLVALVVAAVSAVVSAAWEAVLLTAGVSLAAFCVALACELYLWRARPERRWYEARAAAESVRTLSWKYAVGGEPMPVQLDPRLARELLSAGLAEAAPVDAGAARGDGSAPTPWMDAVREAGLEARRAAYLVHRVAHQRAWYQARASSNAAAALRWRRALVALELAGLAAVAFLLARPAGPLLAGGVAVAAAVAAAAAGSWLQLRQHEQLAVAYRTTLEDIDGVEAQVRAATAQTWSRTVSDAEGAFSREHTRWSASRSLP
jgi:hypothetical protein